MKTRKQYNPRKIAFRINTLDEEHAKELGRIDAGNEYDWFDVEVVRCFDTRKKCMDFHDYNGQEYCYSLFYAGRLYETEEEFYHTNHRR